MYYIIDKKKIMISAQHETKELCDTHLRNAQYLFGNNPDDYIVVKGAKERDAELKKLKARSSAS